MSIESKIDKLLSGDVPWVADIKENQKLLAVRLVSVEVQQGRDDERIRSLEKKVWNRKNIKIRWASITEFFAALPTIWHIVTVLSFLAIAFIGAIWKIK